MKPFNESNFTACLWFMYKGELSIYRQSAKKQCCHQSEDPVLEVIGVMISVENTPDIMDILLLKRK